MDAKTMLDKAKSIIARQDVDRTLLLFFLNMVRKATLRDKDISKLYGVKSVAYANGVISDTSIKHAKTIEYISGSTITKLKKLRNYDEAKELYPDLTITGNPTYYLEVGTEIWIIPVPATSSVANDGGDFSATTDTLDFGGFVEGESVSFGTVTIYGEFWPADLTDSTSSTDIMTVELPEALIYLAAAEYLDYFDETGKGTYWRDKGMFIIDKYIEQTNTQYSYGLDNVVDSYFHMKHRRGDY